MRAVVPMALGPLLGSRPTDNELVIPDLDANDPCTVGHLLRDRHDPTQPKLDTRPLPWNALARLGSARPSEHPDDFVAHLLPVGVVIEQDPGGDALVLVYEARQDVLGADVVVAERQRFAQC
jgi:hypothetical protein